VGKPDVQPQTFRGPAVRNAAFQAAPVFQPAPALGKLEAIVGCRRARRLKIGDTAG
jgi:hypothetical protein